MMDLLICGAPLDNSFHKDKLELVNKGSLGRRRKPSRSNLKQLLSPSNYFPEPSNHIPPKTSPSNNIPPKPFSCNSISPKTSTPLQISVNSVRKCAVNGSVHHKDREGLKNFKPPLRIESSLPRTSSEPNHVNDAHQFTIEAKLKRKKSDVGRSAVLIQTWERRSRSDSFSKRHQATRNSTSNRFQNKENLQNSDTMPESCLSSKSVESLKNGALVSRVRDAYSDEAIIYRMSENGPRYMKPVQMNGKKTKMNGQEPEWISLSRKLCAKFVEGHIEHSSADSYLQDEPDEVQQQVSVTPQQPQRPPHQPQQRPVEKKKVMETEIPNHTNGEPPWIHLSRKLCTKFIEEHIEFPVIIQEESKKEAVVVEPNGDVRIIEKIGQPKGRKSKVKKESEPEWISLSRKLRAKFIESHIDDPDTIALDNQLNASDPEETSSDSLPDASLEVVVQKKTYEIPNEVHINGYKTRKNETPSYSSPYPNRFQPNPQNTLLFTEKECCWEYQEMEFDQESNSGTFQETEHDEQRSPNPLQKTRLDEASNDSYSRDSLEPQVFQDDFVNHNGPTQTSNPHFFNNVECYNNDVSFAPHTTVPEKSGDSFSDCEKKAITVQFISRKENVPRIVEPPVQKCKIQVSEKHDNSSFFNLTTWEEAHYESERDDSERNSCSHSTSLKNKLKSKSMDNICDSTHLDNDDTEGKSVQDLRQQIDNSLPSKSCSTSKSEEFLDKIESKVASSDMKSVKRRNDSKLKENVMESSTVQSSRNDSSGSKDKESDAIEEAVIYDLINSKLNGSRSECSKTSQTDLHLICNDFQNVISNGHGDIDKNTQNGCVNLKIRPECSKTSQTDLHLICIDPQGTENLVSYVNGKTIISDINEFKKMEPIESSKKFRKRSQNSSCSSSDTDDCRGIRIANGEGKNKNSIRNDNNYSRFKVEKNDSRDTKRNDSYSESDSPQNNIKKTVNGVGKKKQSENSVSLCSDERNSSDGQKINEISGMKKHFKCNGAIPNSSNIKSKSSQVVDSKRETKITNVSQSKKTLSDVKINTSTQGNAPVINEYANIQSSLVKKRDDLPSESNLKKKSHSVHSVFQEIPPERSGNGDSMSKSISRSKSSGPLPSEYDGGSYMKESYKEAGDSYHSENDTNRENSLIKIKSKSLHDVSQDILNDKSSDDDYFKRGTKQNEVINSKISPVKFQEFEFPSDIPLCAKLVSKQNGKPSTSSISSSYNRNTSPGSESSHVYEDMFKETTSCPSDSEPSSWTVMKNNSYYVNGRSSSMNDLDLSDSCSMSVKCDYASSGSEQSTLQSRHSSCTSSSFYVNLRDYDQHMLEPSLIRKKKNHKTSCNGNTTKVNSNPPTPESLRHLFTSPLSSIHSPANRTARLVNRLPHEPESHYYSTAAAASSAFKHGFDPTPPKPKKTERSSSIKIKDIAHGIILTFRRFQNHTKSSHVSPTHYVDVSHLAESGSKADGGKSRKKDLKEASRKKDDKNRWGFPSENGKTESDSGCPALLPQNAGHKGKPRRSSSDLSVRKPSGDAAIGDMQSNNISASEKKKSKNGKKNSNARDKGKKTRSKSLEPRTVPTVSRKVQQMADGTLYLVTTVSGDTALPGVYSDSPDTSSELSTHKPVKMTGESNC